MAHSRRRFLMLAGATTAGTVMASPLQMLYARIANGQPIQAEGYGPLVPDPNGLLDLPQGFRYNFFSRTGDKMSDGNPVPGDHDGMAAFSGPNNSTILVRNHELSPEQKPAVPGIKYDPSATGGTTTLIVGPNRKLIRDYGSLAGTYRNCAGGPTPWGSWVSCEENTSTPETNDPADPANNVTKRHGYNFEVPSQASGPVEPVPLVAMGRFNHEAIAVDPNTGIVYETEDRGDSLFYRFIPHQPKNLSQGRLEALKIKEMPQAITKAGFPVGKPMEVEWVPIENPDPATDTAQDGTPTPESVRAQGFAKGAAQFTRGEGTWYGNNEIYFICTDGGEAGFGQVWRYQPGPDPRQGGTITLFVEPNNPEILDGPDNITVAPFQDLIICEDGEAEQFVRGVTPEGQLYTFARNAINDKEFAGACFSPDGQTMFLNIQNPGITFAIWGPWNRRKG